MIHTPPAIGQHFAFAAGRLGSLEMRLLQQSNIDRLIGASTGRDAEHMLGDIDFLSYTEGNSYGETLHQSHVALKEEVERMIPQEKHFIFHILWIEGDRALISYLLKERNDFTSPIARKPEPPVTAGLAKRWEEFFPDLKERKFATPQEIDDAVAQAINTKRTAMVKRAGNAHISRYVATIEHIDMKRAQMRQNGGETDPLSFEYEAVASLRDVLYPMRQIVLGPEPLFAYTVRTLHHIDLLKILMAGKLSGMNAAAIKSLLPPLL